MARKKKKCTLPSGSVRLQVYLGKENVLDENGKPVLDKDGKIKQKNIYQNVTAPTREEAEELKAQLKAAYKVDPHELTVGSAIDRYINSLRAVRSPKTIEGYEIIRQYAFPDLMSRNIRKLDNELLQNEINKECLRPSTASNKKGQPISAKTVQNEWGLISSVIKKYNPKFDIDVKLPSHVAKLNELSKPKDIFNAVKGTEIELAVLLAMWLSFTMSEVKGLTKSSSIKGDYIYIDKVMLTLKNGEFEKNVGKNSKRNRMHRIPPYIKSLIDQIEGDRLVSLSSRTISSRFVSLLKKEGLPHMTFHDLRHVNASVMSFLSIPTEYAMDRGGWNNPDIMQKTYMQIYSSERTKVDNTIDEYFQTELLKEKKKDKKYEAWLTLFDKNDCEESRKEYTLLFPHTVQNTART